MKKSQSKSNTSLKVGDIVNVEWEGDVTIIGAKIVAVPERAGDLWAYEIGAGNVFYLNSACSQFRGFYMGELPEPVSSEFDMPEVNDG